MAAITSAVIAIAGVILAWIAVEIACKPCLEQGREAIDRSLNPDYDPDEDNDDIRSPLNPNPAPVLPYLSAADSSSDPSTATKSV